MKFWLLIVSLGNIQKIAECQLPVLLSATFDDSFQKINLQFETTNDQVIYKQIKSSIVDYNKCEHVFINPFLGNLGTNPSCIVTTAYTYDIFLDHDANINANDTVTVNTTTFTTNGLTVKVSAPFMYSFTPKVEIAGPLSGSFCGRKPVYLSADLSYRQGYGRFSLVDSELLNNGGGVIENIDALFYNVTPTVPTNVSDPTTDFQLKVTLENVFSMQSFGNITTFQLIKEDFTPFVKILKGSIADLQDRIFFYAMIKYPPCWPQDKKPDLFWYMKQKNKMVIFKNVDNKKNALMIGRPKDLTLKTSTLYSIYINVNSKMSSGKPIKLEIKYDFEIPSRDLKITIIGGSRFLYKSEILNLTAYIYDPDAKKKAGVLKWECFSNIETGEECMLNDEEKFKFAALPQISFVFAGDKLKADGKTKYLFRVTETRGARVAVSEPIQLIYGERFTPSFFVSTRKKQYYPDEDIVLSIELSGIFKGHVHMEIIYCKNKLISESPEDHDHLNLIQHLGKIEARYEPKFAKPFMLSKIYDLRIPKNTFPVGLKVECKVDGEFVDYENGKLQSYPTASESFEIITKRVEPKISVYPQMGDAWLTKFMLRAHGWRAKESDLPLVFRFGYIDEQYTKRKVYLTVWSDYNIIEDIVFPLFKNVSQMTYKIFVEVKNQDRVISVAYASLSIKYNRQAISEKLGLKADFPWLKGIDIIETSNIIYNHATLQLIFNESLTDSFSMYAELINEFLTTDIHTESFQKVLDVTKFLVDILVPNDNGTDLGVNSYKQFLDFMSERDNLKLLELDFDYFAQMDDILHWFNKLMQNPKNRPVIYSSIKKFLGIFPQKVCAAIHRDATYDWKPYVSNYPLINVNIYRERFTDDLNVDNTIFQRENLVDEEDKEKEEIHQEIIHKLEKKWGTWNCYPEVYPSGCNGYCMSQIKYDKEMNEIDDKLKNTLDVITDVYEIKFYNSEINRYPKEVYDDMDKTHIKSDEKQDRGFYRIRLPVLDRNVTANDHMRCHLVDPIKNIILPAYNCFTRPQVLYNDPVLQNKTKNSIFALDCNCKRLGRIVGIRDIIPTEYPTLLSPQNFTFYFWGKRDRCEDPKKAELVWKDLRKKLAATLKIDKNRIIYDDCEYDKTLFLMFHFHINDRMGKKRTYDIQTRLNKLVVEHFQSGYIFSFKDGRKDKVELYNVNKTTPKTPRPTIPPFTDVTTDWLPIFLGAGSLTFFFLFCVCFMFCIHTRKLTKNEFTEINSDMPDTSGSEEERLARLTKKDKNIKLNQITEDAIELEVRNSSKNQGKRGQILPVYDGNALITTNSEYIGPDMLDEPQRYHLDDSSDEDDNSVSRSGSSKSFSSAGHDNPQFVGDDNDQGPNESTANANVCGPEDSNSQVSRDNTKDGEDVNPAPENANVNPSFENENAQNDSQTAIQNANDENDEENAVENKKQESPQVMNIDSAEKEQSTA